MKLNGRGWAITEQKLAEVMILFYLNVTVALGLMTCIFHTGRLNDDN